MKETVNRIVDGFKEATKQAINDMLDEMGVHNIMDKLESLPGRIKDQEMTLISARRGLEEAKGELDLGKQITVAEVAEERNGGDGKPKYGNETARSAEVAKRLAVDPAYLAAKKAYHAAEDGVNAAQFELNRLNNEFGACKIVGQMLVAKMQLLAGL